MYFGLIIRTKEGFYCDSEVEMNYSMQYYKGIPLQLINRKYGDRSAKRFTINGTNQNVWIPNKHLDSDGNILPGEILTIYFEKINGNWKSPE